jgi:hypothetical protein
VNSAPRGAKERYSIWVLLALVMTLTACLRWVRFSEFPPGLWYDEAYTLAEAQRLAQGGEFRIYYPEKHGEPAIIWLTALALRLGADHLAPRWVSSISGVVSVLLLFCAVCDVMREESEHAAWLALGSAAVLGVNYEFLFHTRMSWQGALVTTPFIVAVWCFWRALRDNRRWDFIVAGVMTGASQYAGVAARMLALALFLVFLGWLGKKTHHEGHKEYKGNSLRVLSVLCDLCGFNLSRWKGLLAASVAASLVYAPLLHTFLTHPEWFGRRLQTAAPSSTLWVNIGRTLAGWLWIGEAAHHSLPGRPIYDPAMGLLLLVGAAVAIWKVRRPAYNVWLAWFIGVLPGGFLSTPTPMFYRVTPATPATAALCAIGGWRLWQLSVRRFPRSRHLVLLLLLGILAVSAWLTCYDYFVRWANWPNLPAVMDVGKWRAAQVIQNPSPDETILVTIPDRLEPSITYALHTPAGAQARAFDGAHCLIYPKQIDHPIHYVVILGYEHHTLSRLQTLFPSGYQAVDPIFNDGDPYFVNFFIPPGEAPILGELPSPITYQSIALHGVHVPRTTILPGQMLTVTLTWESLEQTTENYTVFVHLLDGTPQAAESPLVTQHDGPPCDAAEPTRRWQTGEYILDEHILLAPSDLPSGEYLLGVGLYNSNTLERLPPTGKNLLIRWDEAIVHTITITNG